MFEHALGRLLESPRRPVLAWPAQYVPVLIMFALAAIVVLVLLNAGRLLGPRNRTTVKLETFECGNEPSGSAWGRFSVKFYLTAILFIVFDVEVVFMYPWAVRLPRSSAGSASPRWRSSSASRCSGSSTSGARGRWNGTERRASCSRTCAACSATASSTPTSTAVTRPCVIGRDDALDDLHGAARPAAARVRLPHGRHRGRLPRPAAALRGRLPPLLAGQNHRLRVKIRVPEDGAVGALAGADCGSRPTGSSASAGTCSAFASSAIPICAASSCTRNSSATRCARTTRSTKRQPLTAERDPIEVGWKFNG